MASIRILPKYIKDNTNDFTKSILYTSVNAMVDGAKEEFEKIVKNHICETHKNNSRGTIVISGSKTKPHIRYSKSNFCCKEFEDSIVMK